MDTKLSRMAKSMGFDVDASDVDWGAEGDKDALDYVAVMAMYPAIEDYVIKNKWDNLIDTDNDGKYIDTVTQVEMCHEYIAWYINDGYKDLSIGADEAIYDCAERIVKNYFCADGNCVDDLEAL